MQFNILITGGLYSKQAALSGWHFCQAALKAGHTISQVFFYQDAVLHGTQLSIPMQDEQDVVALWADCSKQNNIDLFVCVSAAERRGILGDEQIAEYDLPNANLHPQYQIAGLGVLHDAALSSERMVTFK